jgi:hypothetical protein
MSGSIINQFPYNAYQSPLHYDHVSSNLGNPGINENIGGDAKEKLRSSSKRSSSKRSSRSSRDTVRDNRIDNGRDEESLLQRHPYIYTRAPSGDVPPRRERRDKLTTSSSNGEYTQRFLTRNVLNIDSRQRIRNPEIVITQIIDLEEDPISMVSGSDLVEIRLPDHRLKKYDKISITGAKAKSLIIDQPFETRERCPFVRIEVPDSGHGMGPNYDTLTNIYVQIDGVTGDLGNLSSNLVNGLHQVYLTCNYSKFPSNVAGVTDTISFTPKSNYFYILIPRDAEAYYSDRNGDPLSYNNSGVSFTFLFLGGIPLYFLNNGTVQSLESYDAYHSIEEVLDGNRFTIKARQSAIETISGGGDMVQLSKLKNVTNGYPNPEEYTISLPKQYRNVVKVSLLSTEIPNTGFAVNNTNNAIYWQDLDDITATVYRATVTRGNYGYGELEAAISAAMSNVVRADRIGEPEKHNFDVKIDITTNIASISLYRNYTLSHALFFEYVPTTVIGESDNTYMYVIQVDNKIRTGDTITVQQVTDMDFIPISAINGTHNVGSIDVFTDLDVVLRSSATSQAVFDKYKTRKDSIIAAIRDLGWTVTTSIRNITSTRSYQQVLSYPDFYQIALPTFTPILKFPAEYRAVSILTQKSTLVISPAAFRLQFTEQDTIAPLLGFRLAGQPYSVTPYATTLRNIDLYDFEAKLGFQSGSRGGGAALSLTGENYIYLVCPELSSLQTIGSVDNVFAKILLSDVPGKVLFNTYISSPKMFDRPLSELSELRISFRTSTGELYDFNGIDHSFTLEIVELKVLPTDVEISTQTSHRREDIGPDMVALI